MKTVQQLQAQFAAGVPATYDDVADLFMQTATGQATLRAAQLDRAGLVARMREHYPVEADLAGVMAQLFMLATTAAHGTH